MPQNDSPTRCPQDPQASSLGMKKMEGDEVGENRKGRKSGVKGGQTDVDEHGDAMTKGMCGGRRDNGMCAKLIHTLISWREIKSPNILALYHKTSRTPHIKSPPSVTPHPFLPPIPPYTQRDLSKQSLPLSLEKSRGSFAPTERIGSERLKNPRPRSLTGARTMKARESAKTRTCARTFSLSLCTMTEKVQKHVSVQRARLCTKTHLCTFSRIRAEAKTREMTRAREGGGKRGDWEGGG